MNADELLLLLTKIWHAMHELVIGGTGGVVAYMVEYSRNKKVDAEHKWGWVSMFMHLFMGSFIAYIAGTFMGHDMLYRDGLIGLVGLTSYTIIGLLESRFSAWFVNVVMALFPDGINNGKR